MTDLEFMNLQHRVDNQDKKIRDLYGRLDALQAKDGSDDPFKNMTDNTLLGRFIQEPEGAYRTQLHIEILRRMGS